MQSVKAAFNVDQFVSTVKSCFPPEIDSAPLHEPSFGGREWDYVKDCLDSGWVSSVGRYVELFEKRISEFVGMPYVTATVNGTAALHIALRLIGVKAEDEVLVPALSFVALSNAVTYVNAIPHFVESDKRTLGVDPAKLLDYLREIAVVKDYECYNGKTGRRIKALIALHTFGHPADLDPLLEICREFQIELIEDAAQALGSFYKQQHVGRWGKLAILSFNGNKIATTGGGGAILTSDENLAREAKHLTTTAKAPHTWNFYHDEIGFNYRMPNINAALGCAQLEQMPEFLRRKRTITERYKRAFVNLSGVHFFVEPVFARSNYWLNAVLLDPEMADQRNRLLEALHAVKILARPSWELMHRLPMYRGCPRMDLPMAENLQASIINLPSGIRLC